MELNQQANIKILVACHKADPNIRQDDIYIPIQVGKDLHPELNLGFQCDNTGDNISEKNGSYCELTALYWAWKNLKNVDYIGLAHYRRYFDLEISLTSINKIFSKYDVIALKRHSSPGTAISYLSGLLCKEDVVIAIDTLLRLHPEYEASVYKYFYKNNKTSQCNMFIMRWNEFSQYCQFLFGFLGECEKRLLPHSYSRLRRNIGYIAEIFQGLYFLHNRLRIKYVNKEEAGFRESENLFMRLRNLRNWLVFKAVNKPKKINIYPSIITGLKLDGIEVLKTVSNKE